MSTPLELEVAKVVKNDLYLTIVNTRRLVLQKLGEAVRDAKYDYTSGPLAAHDKYFATVGLVGSGISIIGTIVSGIPVAGSIPAAIIGTVGGGVSMIASYQRDFCKPDFKATDDLIDTMRQALITAINQASDGSRAANAINNMKDALYRTYSQDNYFGPGLKKIDLHQRREELVWKKLYRGLDPGSAESQAYDRMKAAVVDLYKAVVDEYPRFIEYVNTHALKQGPPIMVRGNPLPGPIVPDTVARAALMTFEKFDRWLRQTPKYSQWKSKYQIVQIPGS